MAPQHMSDGEPHRHASLSSRVRTSCVWAQHLAAAKHARCHRPQIEPRRRRASESSRASTCRKVQGEGEAFLLALAHAQLGSLLLDCLDAWPHEQQRAQFASLVLDNAWSWQCGRRSWARVKASAACWQPACGTLTAAALAWSANRSCCRRRPARDSATTPLAPPWTSSR